MKRETRLDKFKQATNINTIRQTNNMKQPWYQDGLQFECAGCGGCCTGAPGFVWVTPTDITRISKLLGMSEPDFESQFTRTVAGVRTSLKEHLNGDCYFFDPITRHCQIYDVRPAQCRTWPFWSSVLESRKTWRQTAQRCPGCNQGKLYSIEEIEKRRTEFDV